MPLQLVWIGLRQYFATARKIFLAFIIFFAFMYLFFAFVGVDRARQQTRPTVAQVEEARRLRMYDYYSPKNDPVDDEETVLMRDMSRGFLCRTIGELCTNNPSEAHLYKKDSISYKVSGFLAEPLRHPPSSFYYWAKGTLENAGFAPKTYAQGIGFAALTSFQPIWKVFRNIAYLIIVVVIMVVGFMVMFRVGGGGKNAVTLESALPKLVIALLAISMSYALAGLLIDVMYLSIALLINLLGPVSGMTGGEQNKFIAGVITGYPVNLMFTLFGGIGNTESNYLSLAGSLYSLVPGWMQTIIDGIVNTVVIGTLGQYVSTTKRPGSRLNAEKPGPKDMITFIGRSMTLVTKKVREFLNLSDMLGSKGSGPLPISTIANVIYIVFGWVVGALIGDWIIQVGIMIILILGMLVIFLRLFFMLIGNYIEIILSILTAPLALMLEAIPGQNAFINWAKGLAVSLSVYPIVLVIMLITRAISNAGSNGAPMWAPPFVTQITDQTSLQTIITGILIYSIPNIVKAYKQKLKPASAIDSMGIGLGSLFVGAAPILKGSSTVLGASGLSGAMASRVSEPLAKAFGMAKSKVTGNWVKSSDQPEK